MDARHQSRYIERSGESNRWAEKDERKHRPADESTGQQRTSHETHKGSTSDELKDRDSECSETDISNSNADGSTIGTACLVCVHVRDGCDVAGDDCWSREDPDRDIDETTDHNDT